MDNNTQIKINIIKRDGTTKVPYNYSYIESAIDKAIQSYNLLNNNKINIDKDTKLNIKERIESCIVNNINNKCINIETIQDIVESTLMLMELEPIAKQYILYRNKRNEIRTTTNQISDCIDEILNKSSNDSNLKRDNANIDGNTAMGTMLQIGANSSKIYYLENMINKTASDHHKKGLIHIHDLDFYALTVTCCQIDCLKLLKNGFCTGHGFLREPNSISSYAALAAIAIQSDQNDCHGGQSIPNFDYSMAPGIKKSFRKILIQEIKDYVLYKDEIAIPDYYFNILEEEPELQYIDKYLNKFKNDYIIDLDMIKKNILSKLNRECYQAMEGFVHNLNTMHSRAGAQVPFSSINLGTDISLEGRMVTKNLLLAMNAGLGHGETAIFPIVVFKVKKGINFNKEDPNYDLFKLSFKVTAKRLFPNYVFLDTPFNSKNYVEGHPETEVATMGCVSGKETVTYKYTGSDTIYNTSIERMWDITISKACLLDKSKSPLTNRNIILNQDNSEYIDTHGCVEIYDSAVGNFVDCKKIIRNLAEYNKDKWVKLHFSNGKSLICTNDHPLPVLQSDGLYERTYVKDMNIGDIIPITNKQYSSNSLFFDSDIAWLLGVIISSNNPVDMKINGLYDIQYIIKIPFETTDKVVDILTGQKMNCSINVKYDDNDDNLLQEISIRSNNEYQNIMILTCISGNLKYMCLPELFFNYNNDAKKSLINGIFYLEDKVNVKNKTLALQIQSVVNSLNINSTCVITENNDNYTIELKHIKSSSEITDTVSIINIENLENHVENSYDVETASDRFDVSGIISHNCRTRVVDNINGPATTYGRGNLSFTSINLPRLAIISKDESDFYEKLDYEMSVVEKQLLERFEIQCKRKVNNMPFLMGQGVWIESDKLKSDDEVREVLKHGTLAIGFVGLAEAMVRLYGHHHGEGDEYEEKALNIIKFMRKRTDEMTIKHHLNFGLLATPAESLAGRFLEIDRKEFGIIDGITDKDFYTNSFHIPVNFNITAFDKIRLEAPFHELTNGGHITYIELDGDISNNIDVIEKIVRYMAECNIGYGSINHPVDRDPVCGYTGVINDECPNCHRHETSDEKFERIRRITGYLTGDVSKWNNGKKAEEKMRVKHGI